MTAIGVACLVSLGVVAMALAAACIGPAPGWARPGTPASRAEGQSRFRVPDQFVDSNPSPSELRWELDLRSVRTGRIVRRLARFGDNLTNNGLALSPDGREVYFTLIPSRRRWSSLLLERITVSDRKQTRIGPGEEPAISPDGRLLAYTTDAPHAQAIVVRDLALGVSRSVNVSKLLGSDGDLLTASLAWVADDSTLVVLPGSVVVPAGGRSRTMRSSNVQPSAVRLLVIRVGRPALRLTATSMIVSDFRGDPASIYSDSSQPDTVLASAWAGDDALIDTIRLTPTGASAQSALRIRNGLVDTIDPTGQHVIYLQGSNPPALWRATITNNHLTHRHRLFRDSPVGTIAW